MSRSKIHPHICVGCGVEYMSTEKVHKYCTYECFCTHVQRAPRPWQVGKKFKYKDRLCAQCGVSYAAKNGKHKFCVPACKRVWNLAHVPSEKMCASCKKVSDISDFAVSDIRGTASTKCKSCVCKREKTRRHKDGGVKYHAANMRRNYGLSPEDYEELGKRQGGVCGICRGLNEDGHRLYVDHCHETGQIRGLLCRRCNSGLGMFRDDWRTTVRAVHYLENWFEREGLGIAA